MKKLDLIIRHPETNKPISQLNGRLLKARGKEDSIEAIKAIHQLKILIYEAMEQETELFKLIEYAKNLTLCEFELQKLWGFPEDGRYHRFWLAPKCSCPKLDNEDLYPSIYYYIEGDCPIHGYPRK